MDLKLRVWRQAGTDATGAFEDIDATDISPEMSFLEMFDVRQRAARSPRAASRSRSTTTAARASAARAR